MGTKLTPEGMLVGNSIHKQAKAQMLRPPDLNFCRIPIAGQKQAMLFLHLVGTWLSPTLRVQRYEIIFTWRWGECVKKRYSLIYKPKEMKIIVPTVLSVVLSGE